MSTDAARSGASIRLYTQAFNPFSEKVAAALALKGLPYERVVSDAPEDVARWSPIERTLPVLEIDGQRRADSHAIVAWLDERFPEPLLHSSDPRTAEAQRQLAQWSDDSFTFYWNRWRAARYPRPGDESPVDDSILSRLRDQLRRRLRASPRSRAEARELEIVQEMIDRMSDLEGFLGDRPFFHADAPSIADITVYAMLRVLRAGPIPYCAEAIDERPRLAAFLTRMQERVGTLPWIARLPNGEGPAHTSRCRPAHPDAAIGCLFPILPPIGRLRAELEPPGPMAAEARARASGRPVPASGRG